MKKIFTFLFFTALFLRSFAQLDTEHWFAPMVENNTSNSQINNSLQSIYFSTNVITPFQVTVYNNNIAFGTVTISKGNPASLPIPRNFIITTKRTDIFTPTKLGLYTKADQPYFANLRFSTPNHAEILTSKGKSGIGTKFYAVVAPILSYSQDNINFMTSVLATEDGTNVTFSGYKSSTKFGSPQGSVITFSLNKGESYIIDGGKINEDGFTGAKIVSNKPVSVTNGNFNGQYTVIPPGTNNFSSDILMDQSVPVERLGNEFALIKGNGSIGNNMEGGLIVATENNTEIFINDIATPVKTLNEGEYYIIPDTFYSQTVAGGIFNIYVTSTKNIYLYQLLAGANSIATGGFNYIPPLSCYFPKEVGEIGLIDENPGYSGTGNSNNLTLSPTRTTKLNIVTQVNAEVKVNGVILNSPTEGPFPLKGNSLWVTYSKENVSGNITVTSTKAVTAGIAAGDGNVGYGGYFAGFSTIPAITKQTGDCLPGIILEVNAAFDTYKWYNENSPDPIEGANGSSYKPLVPGNYYLIVSSGSCDPLKTASFKILNCVKLTTVSENVCGSKIFTPKFTSSTQQILNSTVIIKTQGSKGLASVDPATGIVTYTANPGATGTDSFVYKFCGNAPFEDCEEVTVNLTLAVLTTQPATLTLCKKADGTADFNLNSADITTNVTIPKTYYATLSEAQADLAGTPGTGLPTTYNSTGGDVYAVVRTPEGCSQIEKITLAFFPEIMLDTANFNAVNCDNDLDGIIKIDFQVEVTPNILQNASYFRVRYYLTQGEADNGSTPGLGNNFSYSVDTPVFIRVDSPDSCPFKTAVINFKIGQKPTLNSDTTSAPVCDKDLNGSEDIKLIDYISLFTTEAGVSARYFATLSDAENGLFGTDIPLDQTITGTKSFYYRFYKAGFCDISGTLTLNYSTPKKSASLPSTDIVCEGSTKNYDLGTGFSSITWDDNTTNQTKDLGVGNHFVDLGSNGCVYRQFITITEFKKAVLTTSDYNEKICDNDFDGNANIKFSEITPVILLVSTGFTVSYYRDANYTNKILSNDFAFNTDTTVYVRVESQYCPPVEQPLLLKIGTTLPLTATEYNAPSECDDDLDGVKTIDLSKYIGQFTSQTGLSVEYYSDKKAAETQNQQFSVSSSVSVNQSGIYYLRLLNQGNCPVIVKLNVSVKVPEASSKLVDQSICPGTKTTLEAGDNFSSYKWSRNGETTSSIENVEPGIYYVDLGIANGCIYRQKVIVTEIVLPKITAIDIQGTTVTITAMGGNPPYQYSLDGRTYQSSNVFYNVKVGKNTVLVTSADGCDPVVQDFALINITNSFTPNGDGINDTFNYSDLMTKDEPKFVIYDRYGRVVFTGGQNNNFTWDGTTDKRKSITNAYWYILEWKEFGTSTAVKYSGWVLLKNTNF